MNKLERNRYKAIIYLTELRDHQADTRLFGKLESVSNLHELKVLPEGFNSLELNQMDDSEILNLIKDIDYKREKDSAFDIKVNGNPYRLLTTKNYEFVIIKDKTRYELEDVCSRNNIDLELIDNLIRDYWDFLDSNTIKRETLLNNNFNSNCSGELLKLIKLHLFGADSNNKLLLINKPFRIDSWQLVTQENFYNIFKNKLYISIESNMKVQKIGKLSKIEQDSINKWTGFYQNQFLGALRVKLG